MEEKEGIKDSSLLEKSNVPESINEDISKTTDVDLNSDGKKDNDTSAKDGAPKVEEKANKSSGIDEDEVVTPAEDAKKKRRSIPPYLPEGSLRRSHLKRIQYCKN